MSEEPAHAQDESNVGAEEQIRKAADAVHRKFNDFTGIEKLEGFSLTRLLSEVFGRHTASNNVLLSVMGKVQSPVDAMLEIVKLRGILSPLGHIVWTAICGAAIWRVKGGKPFAFAMVKDGRFWHLFLVPVVLHIIWNMDFTLPFYLKYVLLGVIAWIVVLALLQEGLKELRAEKAEAAEGA